VQRLEKLFLFEDHLVATLNDRKKEFFKNEFYYYFIVFSIKRGGSP